MEMNQTEFERADVDKNKDMAAIGYVLFFLPLITCKDSQLGRYCANQGLLLTIAYAAANIVLGLFSNIIFIGFLFRIAQFLVTTALLVLSIYMAVQLRKYGRVMTLPYIGHISLIK